MHLKEKVLEEGKRIKTIIEEKLKEGNEEKAALFGVANSANLSLYVILNSVEGIQLKPEDSLKVFFPEEVIPIFAQLVATILIAYSLYALNKMPKTKEEHLNIVKEFFTSELLKYEDENLRKVAEYVKKKYFA
jgi:hypothetical protein